MPFFLCKMNFLSAYQFYYIAQIQIKKDFFNSYK